jgi:hypothetical protein
VKRLVAVAVLAFVAGAWAALALVDRLYGGHGPTLELAPFDEPGGGWER